MRPAIFPLLVLATLVLLGCESRQREAESEQRRQGARQQEAARVDAIVREHMSGIAEARGSALILVEPAPDVFKNEGELACGVAQLQLRDGLFDTVQLITLDVEKHTEQEQLRLSLPYAKPLPPGCELPPPGYYR